MIFDSLTNFSVYQLLHPMFKDVQAFISTTNLHDLPIGKHPINELGAYASVNEYLTKSIEESFIECHRKYIDLQILVWGEEKVGVAPKHSCVEQFYDATKDLQKLIGMVDYITLVPGLFAIFFPDDAHKPSVKSGVEAVSVKKIVFKIPV
ncbi:MAG: YhcH/YjgK/YiaL family protein [Desulfoprunum sp.]|nr:YhcH/YjgK/YiaL family protein [Desulfoprunum sp.]